jgi:hypothetical protein
VSINNNDVCLSPRKVVRKKQRWYKYLYKCTLVKKKGFRRKRSNSGSGAKNICIWNVI